MPEARPPDDIPGSRVSTAGIAARVDADALGALEWLWEHAEAWLDPEDAPNRRPPVAPLRAA